MGDLDHGRYALVPNHVTEYDGLLFGTLIPNMLVVAKSDWITNPYLNEFIDKLFSIVGLVRKDNGSEQVSPEFPTRIVFGDPIVCENKDDFGAAWLEAEFKLRDSITAPATRPPVLCAKHQKPISQRDF